MGCRLKDRKTPDGVRIAIILPDDVRLPTEYYLASDLTTPWTGTPSTLLPCVDCEPISETVTINNIELITCVTDSVTFDVSVREVGRGSSGYGYFIPPDDRSSVPATWTIDVPAAAPGSVLALHMISGGDGQIGTLNDNILNDPAIADALPAGTLGPYTQIHNFNSNWEYDTNVWLVKALTGAAGTIDVTWPNETQGIDPLIGLANYIWVEFTRTDGQPLEISDFDQANSTSLVYAGAISNRNPDVRYNFVNPSANCKAFGWTSGRHVVGPTDTDIDAIVDADWLEYQATTGTVNEIYDVASENNPFSDLACQLGAGFVEVLPGAALDIQTNHNTTSGNTVPDRDETFFIPVNCEKTECAIPVPRDADEIPYSSPDCDRTFTKRIRGNVAFSIPNGGVVQLMPTIDGNDITAGAISSADGATNTIDFTHTIGNVASGQSGSCALNWRLISVSGDTDDAAVDVTGLTVQVDGAI